MSVRLLHRQSKMKPIGVHTHILHVLKIYRKGLHIDFVAKAIGRQPYEIKEAIERLKEQGVLKQVGDLVFIHTKRQSRKPN